LLGKERQVHAPPLLEEWNDAVREQRQQEYEDILDRISRKWNIEKLNKILLR
jgi:hypothetical protein